MLAPVVVDLGPEVGARDVQIVLAACNAAITNGRCVPASAVAGETPRAVAVAHADARVLLVRIEVRLGPDDPGSPLVRELEFARRDPLRERWRSVGFAIATLVGEGEQRAREEAAEGLEPAPAPPEQTVPSAAPPEADPAPVAPSEPATAPAPSAAPRREAPSELADADDVAARTPPADTPPADTPPADTPLEPRQPLEHRPVFVGLGVLAGSGFGGGAGRAGAVLRAGWQGRSGWQVATSFHVAWRVSEDVFTAGWVSLEAGGGYRWSVSEAVSIGALLFAGLERSRFEVLAGGVTRSEALLAPRLGLALDVRWRATQSFGAWASAEGSSSGRERRLFIAPERDPVESLPVDLALTAGVGWWLE